MTKPLHPPDGVRFQLVVAEFMSLARQEDGLNYPEDHELVDQFCCFVDDPAIWHLVDPMVPEFTSRVKRSASPG